MSVKSLIDLDRLDLMVEQITSGLEYLQEFGHACNPTCENNHIINLGRRLEETILAGNVIMEELKTIACSNYHY